jgi:hypothetical protein
MLRLLQKDQEVSVGQLDSLLINFGISQRSVKLDPILIRLLEIFLILEWDVMKRLRRSVRLSRFQIFWPKVLEWKMFCNKSIKIIIIMIKIYVSSQSTQQTSHLLIWICIKKITWLANINNFSQQKKEIKLQMIVIQWIN